MSDHCCIFFCSVCQCVVLEKRRGCSENLADMKTVRYCFVTFVLHLVPPFLQDVLFETTSKLLVRQSFIFCVFTFAFCDGGEKCLRDVWEETRTRRLSPYVMFNLWRITVNEDNDGDSKRRTHVKTTDSLEL